MPRDALKERSRVVAAVEQYIKPIISGDDDGRTLSLNGVAKALHISRMTLRKHGVRESIEAAALSRAEIKGPRVPPIEVVRLRAVAAEMERDDWKRRYEHLLEQFMRIDVAIRARRDIDLDAILAKPLRKADRDSPTRKGVRRSSLGRPGP